MTEEPSKKKSSHSYDEAMRTWGESNLAGVAAWLDPSLPVLPQDAFVKRTTALNDPLLDAPVLHLDLIIAIGAERVMHVEYETRPRRGLADRMYDYRARLKREHPGRRLTQHVIVLGDGKVIGHDDYEANDFVLNLRPIYLREHDPSEYLADPFLAPFATLARGSPQQREQSFAAALRLLGRSAHPLANLWILCAVSLARLRLDGSTIDRLRREEHMMSLHPFAEFLRKDTWGQQLMDLGREEGLEKGREAGCEWILLALLRIRFGNSPETEAAARVLSGWDNAEAVIAAISAAGSPEELLRSATPEPFSQ